MSLQLCFRARLLKGFLFFISLPPNQYKIIKFSAVPSHKIWKQHLNLKWKLSAPYLTKQKQNTFVNITVEVNGCDFKLVSLQIIFGRHVSNLIGCYNGCLMQVYKCLCFNVFKQKRCEIIVQKPNQSFQFHLRFLRIKLT